MKLTARTAHANPQHDSERDTNPQDYFKEVANNVDIYDIDELGPTTGTVFQIFANNNQAMKINTLFDTGAMKSVMSLEMYKKLKLNDLNTTSIPHVVGASGESLGARGKTKCEININGRLFYQTFIVCEHLKRPIILGRDFSIKNCIGISWTKSNTRQLTQNNEVIAETAEYQSTAIASVSLKRNIKVPPRSCAVVDVDINSTEEIKVEVIPDQLWLSANPNICTYPMIADLKDRQADAVTPFIIVNFSHHEHLHLPKNHVVAFAEKYSNEGIASKPYTLPLKHYEWVQKEIETLERAGKIERSISPWASPVVIVPKKSAPGEPPRRRMCVDIGKLTSCNQRLPTRTAEKVAFHLYSYPKSTNCTQN